MNEPATPSMRADPDESALAYKPISKLAIAALLLGLLSAVALANPGLWLVPGIAIVVGLLAWQSTSKGESAGWVLAMIGLVTASLFGGWAISSHMTRTNHLKNSTRQYALDWLALVNDDKFNEAFQYLFDTAKEVKPPSKTYEEYFEELPVLRTTRDEMLERSPVKELIQFDGELVFVRSLVTASSGKGARVAHRFRFLFKDENETPRELTIVVELKGVMNDDNDAMQWYVVGIDTRD